MAESKAVKVGINGYGRIGRNVLDPGLPVGGGLARQAALELGLRPGTPVGAGMIDAHAGGIGTVGADGDAESCMAYVFGTSSCTMTSRVRSSTPNRRHSGATARPDSFM